MKTFVKGKNARKGFTLIELIVVIAIIGILLVLAIPRLMGYTEIARERSDEQLATLYQNTFNVLLASGKITVDGSATVKVSKDGTIDGNDDITFVDSSPANLKAVQDQYITKNGIGDEASIPSFQSKKFSNGITITINSDSVTVSPATADS